MKRSVLFVLLVLTTVFALAGPSHAVTLEQGWYAGFGDVLLEGSAYPYQYWTVRRYMTSATGQFGPILVEEGYHLPGYQRKVTVGVLI